MSQENPYNAKVAAILTDEGFVEGLGNEAVEVWDLVLNIGSENGVAPKNVFLIFTLGPEILDPETNESLGHFEVVRGQARVTHLQAKMCTVRSTRTVSKSFPKNSLNALAHLTGGDTEIRQVPVPFKIARVGDFARLIS